MIYSSEPTEAQVGEIIAGAPDAIAIMAGAAPAHPHPLANALDLKKIAHACGTRNTFRSAISTPMSVVAAGMGSSHFSALLAEGLTLPTVGAYSAQAEHLAFTVPLSLEKLQEVDLPTLDADTSLEPLVEHAEQTHFTGFVGAGTVKAGLTSYARLFGLSRVAIINGDLSNFVTRVIGSGVSAARLEAKLVARALDTNPNLDDGQPVFAIDHLNVIAEPLSSGALGGALSLLRTQKTGAGELADLAARHLVVAPALEMTARDLVRNSGLDARVSVLANLPAWRWYVLADPKIHPVVGVLRLGNSKNPVRLSEAKRPMDYEGTVISVAADLGAVLLRRTGIVRGGGES